MNAHRSIFTAIVLLAGSGMAQAAGVAGAAASIDPSAVGKYSPDQFMPHAAGAAASADAGNLSEAPADAGSLSEAQAYPGVGVMEEVVVTASRDDFAAIKTLLARLQALPPIEIVTATAKYPQELRTADIAENVAATQLPRPERMPPELRVYRANPPSFEMAGPAEFAIADDAAVTMAWEFAPASIKITGQELAPRLPDLATSFDGDSGEEGILRF